jgi:hypothetical protein
MLKRLGASTGFALKSALLCLCIAVVAWGLHAKLVLYGAPASQSAITVAKLSTEKHSSATLAAIRQAVEQPSTWATLSLLFLVALPDLSAPSIGSYPVDVGLFPSSNSDSQDPRLMRRPPPVIS